MSRRAARCSQADIARAVRAVAQTGSTMAVEIMPDGTIRIVPTPPPREKKQRTALPDDIGL